MDIYVIMWLNRIDSIYTTEDAMIGQLRNVSEHLHFWHNIHDYLDFMGQYKFSKYTLVGDTFVEDKDYR